MPRAEGPGIPLGIDQLRAIMPRLLLPDAMRYLIPLQATMDDRAISFTPCRMAAFLAQLAHESAQLRFWEELASGAAYEGRTDLGNAQPGQGALYKGRGPIQITGLKNYRRLGELMKVDLVGSPERLLEARLGFEAAGWYWVDRVLNKYGDLNELADVHDFKRITLAVNGGLTGLEHRLRFYTTARRVLGCLH